MENAIPSVNPGPHHAEILLLHPAGSEDPQRISLAIGLLEWIRLWLESRQVRATLWPETVVDPQGHRRFIMRPGAWGAPAVRRRLQLAPAVEGVVYMNLAGAPQPDVANVSLEDRRGDRLAQVTIPLTPDGIFEGVPGALEHLMKALELTFTRQTSAELFHTTDRGTAIASLYAIERTVAFGAGVGGDDPQRLLEPILQTLARDPAHPIGLGCLLRMVDQLIVTGVESNQAAAISGLERWCALSPLSPVPYYHLAIARQRIGKAEEARAAYEESLRLDPSYLPSLQGYADWFGTRGFTEQGLAVLRQAIGKVPFAGNLLDQVGCLLANAGRLNEAEPVFRQAIGAEGPLTARANLARALLALDREDEALDAISEGLNVGIDPAFLEILANLSRRSGLAAARARAIMRGRIAEGSGEEMVQGALVQLSLEMDGPAAAAQHARKLIALASAGATRRYAYGVILRSKIPEFGKRWDAAFEALSKLKTDEMEPAAAFFREVVDAEPEFGHANFVLALALEQLGRLREALPFVERAAVHEADDPSVLDLLARARADAGDIPGAAQIHYRAASLAPKDPRILRNAALSLVRAGFVEEGFSLGSISMALEPNQPDFITALKEHARTARRGAKGRWRDRIIGFFRGGKGPGAPDA